MKTLRVEQSCYRGCVTFNSDFFVPIRQWAPIRGLASTKDKLLPNSLYPLPDLNPSPPRHNGCHFADDIFRFFFVTEKICVLMKFWLNFVQGFNCQWHKIGLDNGLAPYKPLSELMRTRFIDAYMRHTARRVSMYPWCISSTISQLQCFTAVLRNAFITIHEH